MKAEKLSGIWAYLAIDGGSKWQILEELRKHLPDILVSVLLETLFVEAVELIDFPELYLPYRFSWLLAAE